MRDRPMRRAENANSCVLSRFRKNCDRGLLDNRLVSEAFLASLHSEDREALLATMRRREFEAGDVLLRQGEPGNEVIVLLAGRVKIVARAVSSGTGVLLGLRGAGDLLGELAAIDAQRRLADAVALEAGAAAVASAIELRGLLAERPGISLAVIRMLAGRLREADRGRTEFATRDSLGRVALRLLDLIERHGVPAREGLRIELPITQEELAGWSGSSRAAVARALALMRRLGWVTTSRQMIVVHDLGALRALR
jgi:CRP-like cAMP-binding protein